MADNGRDEKRADEQTSASADSEPLAEHDVAGRWRQWVDRQAQISEENPEEKVSRLATWFNERRMLYDERRLAGKERAKCRREERAISRSSAIVERDLRIEQVSERLGALRSLLSAVRTRGASGAAQALWSRRWVRIVVVLVLVAGSGATGALTMRAKNRRYAQAVLVAVNGTTIRRTQLLDELYAMHGAQALRLLTERELRRQFVASKKATATAAQISERLRVESRAPEFMKTLQAAGKSEEEYRQSLGRVLGEVNLVTQGVSVNEPELREFYRRNTDPRNPRSRFYSPARTTIAVIAAVNKVDAASAAAELKAGAPWADVARRYSVDPSAAQGGLAPPIVAGRSPYASATGIDRIAMDLEPGQQAGPLELRGYWWLVRCLSRQPAQTRKYDDVAPDVRLYAMLEKGEALNKDRLDREYAEFRKRASVQEFAAR